MPPFPKDGECVETILHIMYLFCDDDFAGIFEVEEWMAVKKHGSTSVSGVLCISACCSDHGCVSIVRVCVCVCVQVQWEWQESGTTWRSYGRIENRIIEVCKLLLALAN